VKGRAVTDQQKEDILRRLEAVWKQAPALRLGQLIANIFRDPYYTEDFTLIRELEEFYLGVTDD
jgi:hypothetical protein